jgi:TetR/AcrR family transcriptional regulator of autoinduction and epiphytic fitness
MVVPEAVAVDGRRARRERNRTAVIDAVFSLLDEGVVPPATEAIAERAGVSVSSVFRYFDSLDDLQTQAVERHFERFAPLFEIPALGVGSLDERIGKLVTARIALYRTVGSAARLARARALDHPVLAQHLARTRRLLARQLRLHFADELRVLPRPAADDLVGLIDTLTSFESWDLLRATHDRSDRLIRRAWVDGLARLLAQPD